MIVCVMRRCSRRTREGLLQSLRHEMKQTNAGGNLGRVHSGTLSGNCFKLTFLAHLISTAGPQAPLRRGIVCHSPLNPSQI